MTTMKRRLLPDWTDLLWAVIALLFSAWLWGYLGW